MTDHAHSAAPEAYRLDDTDAMAITIAATDAFVSLDIAQLPPELGRGAVLMYEALISRVKRILPNDASMAHVHDLIGQMEEVARMVRRLHDLPPKV